MLPNILPCNHITKLSYVSREKEGNHPHALSAVHWRTGSLRYKWNADKQQRRVLPEHLKNALHLLHPIITLAFFCSYLMLVTHCYCMLRQDVQVAFGHLSQLQSLVYYRISLYKSLRAWLWTLHDPISISLHNIMLSLFLLFQGRGTSLSLSLFEEPSFDWQEQIRFSLCDIDKYRPVPYCRDASGYCFP